MHANRHLLTALALFAGAYAKIKYVGVAIPGIDFGCDIDGSCPIDTNSFPLSSYGGGDGEGQMKHYVENVGMNMFRLPLTWQYIVNGKLGGKLDSEKFGHYNKLMQICLDTGAYCMIDVHNFARFDGGIIGQGGPSDDDFVDLWVQFATEYADNDKVVFGLMNEPHDLDIKIWAKTCQKAVTGIRKAGAKTHMILLPGTNFASAETFVSTGSADALATIENPDGSTDGLIMDIHKYLDINNSGTHKECTTDNVKAFETVAAWLRKNKRLGIVSESGASTDPSCMEKFCAQNECIAENSDVLIGFVGWGAGSFDDSYVLSLTPSGSAGSFVDNKLMKQCIIKPFISDAESSKSTQTSQTKTTTGTPTSTKEWTTSTKALDGATTSTEAPSHPIETSSTNASYSQNDGDGDDSGGTRKFQPMLCVLAFATAASIHTWLRFL